MFNSLANQLIAQNSQLFQQIEQLKRNGGNPIEVFKQVTRGYTPEQMDNFFNRVKNMGFSDDLINQLKDGVGTQKWLYKKKGE